MQLLKKTNHQPANSKDLIADLRICEERRKFFLSAVQLLLHFIQEFAFDLKEINSEAFKKGVSSLSHQFASKEDGQKTRP